MMRRPTSGYATIDNATSDVKTNPAPFPTAGQANAAKRIFDEQCTSTLKRFGYRSYISSSVTGHVIIATRDGPRLTDGQIEVVDREVDKYRERNPTHCVHVKYGSFNTRNY